MFFELTAFVVMLVRFMVWAFTAGWPIGAGIAVVGFVGSMGYPENFAFVMGALAAASGLVVRFKMKQIKARQQQQGGI